MNLIRTPGATLRWYLTHPVAYSAYAFVAVLALLASLFMFGPEAARRLSSTASPTTTVTATPTPVVRTVTAAPIPMTSTAAPKPTTTKPAPKPTTKKPAPKPTTTAPKPKATRTVVAPAPPVVTVTAKPSAPKTVYVQPKPAPTYNKPAPQPTYTNPAPAPVNNSRTVTKTYYCNAPVTLNVNGSGTGNVITKISGTRSSIGSTFASVAGPAGNYTVSVTDSAGHPRMSMSAAGAVCS